ncbi:chorismate mutase [bacterium]|nr:chorismate mutase [bacterium]
MITKGIRGAITVDSNTESSLKEATLELLNTMVSKNNIDVNMISHVVFTTTEDLNAAFPAKFARLDMGWTETAMMCFHELPVPNSLKMCLRVLVVLNCEKDFCPEFVYLKGATQLRK